MKMNVRGKTAYERRMNQKSRSFQYWFNNALNRADVTVDGVETTVVIQDQSQSNNKDLSDDKYIILENGIDVRVGSIITWRDHYWIVFTDELKTIPTHQQIKVKESNGVIKWMIGDKISGNGEGHRAYIQNQTLYTLGVSTSGTHAWIANAKMMVYIQDNEEARTIKRGQRIFIGGMVYQVMFKDYVSRKGLIHFLLEEDFINDTVDNIELGVADYYPNIGNLNEGIETPILSPKEVVISGADKLKIGSTSTFDAGVYDESLLTDEAITEWVIADTESCATVVSQDRKSITIRIEQNFKKVGSTISIIAKSESGVINSKTVNIISPY